MSVRSPWLPPGLVPTTRFTRTIDDTISVGRVYGKPIDLLRLSPVLQSVFPDGCCAVDEFVIQKAMFSDPAVFVEIHVDDTIYGPFGGPWMASESPRVAIETPAPRAVRGQQVKIIARFRYYEEPTPDVRIHLRCLVRVTPVSTKAEVDTDEAKAALEAALAKEPTP